MIRIRYEPTGDTVVARAGETVMERLHALGAPIESACRGNGACGTCVVWVEEGGEQIDPAGEAETALLRRREGVSRARLSCQARVRDGADGTLRVRLPAQRLGRLEADRRARIFRRVYLDHLALTGVTDGARRAVQEALGRAVGEPGGSHAASARAREAAREVRGSIAAALGVGEGSVRLHRSRREAVVALLLGSWSPDAGRIAQDAGRTLPDEILLGPWEDPEIPSIASGARPLRVRVLVPDGRGIVTPDAIRSAIGPRTRCVFLSRADRYLGIVQPVEDLVAACGEVPLIVDTTRAAGRCAPAPWGGLAAQIVGPESVGGPSGVAVVVLGEGRSIVPPWPLDLALARDEELVVPASGFAEALRERWAASEGGVRPLADLASALEPLVAAIEGARIVGAGVPRLAGVVAATFEGIPPGRLGAYLDWEGVAARWAPAGAEGAGLSPEGAAATGLEGRAAENLVTFSVGWTTTPADIERAVERLKRAVEAVRALEPEPLTGVHYVGPVARARFTPRALTGPEKERLDRKFAAGAPEGGGE